MQAMLETYCRTERKAEGEIYRKRTCRGIQNENKTIQKGKWKRDTEQTGKEN